MWHKIKPEWILLGVGIFFIFFGSGHIESIDGMGSLNMARNLVYKGTWDVADPKYGVGGGTTDPIDGKYYSAASKGLTVAMIPAVWLSRVVYQYNGFEPVPNFPLESDYLLTFLASFVNPVLGFALFIVLWQLFNEIFKNRRMGIWLAVIVVFSTNILPMAKHSFPNLLVTLEMMLIIFGLVKWQKQRKWFWLVLVGTLLLALWWSYNLSVILVYLLVAYYVWDINFWGKKNASKSIITLGILSAVGMAVVILVMGGSSWLRNFVAGEGNQRDVFQAVWGMLLSPGRSIVMYSPIWGLAIVMAWQTFLNSRWSRLLMVGTVVYVGFYSLFDIWSGELSWGPRYLVPLIPLAGLALADNWQKVNKKWLLALVIVGIYVQMVGITVPYETQFQGLNVGKFTESEVDSRQAQFDYWSLGEFMPKYSPIYRLKKNLVHRWLLVPKYFRQRPEIVFAGGATLPIEGESMVRRIGSKFSLMSAVDLDFNTMTVNNFSKNLNEIKVCAGSSCQIGMGKYIDGQVVFEFDKPFSIKGGDQIQIEIIVMNRGQRYELRELWLGSRQVDMSSYKLALADSFYNKNVVSTDDREELYQRYYDRKSVTNMTADFWWVRQAIYFW